MKTKFFVLTLIAIALVTIGLANKSEKSHNVPSEKTENQVKGLAMEDNNQFN